MRIEKSTKQNVRPDGTKVGGGAVITNGSIRMSYSDSGCNLEGCNCSDGNWISIILPRTENGEVEVIKVLFEDDNEMKSFFENRFIDGVEPN